MAPIVLLLAAGAPFGLADAKSDCIKYISELFKNEKFNAVLHGLKLSKDSKEVDGLTIEITPETDEDAFGGWWVSVYSTGKLNAARATEEELAAITEEQIISADNAADKAEAEKKPIAKTEPRKEEVAAATPTKTSTTPTQRQPWNTQDMRYARIPRVRPHVIRVYTRGFSRAGGHYSHAVARHR